MVVCFCNVCVTKKEPKYLLHMMTIFPRRVHPYYTEITSQVMRSLTLPGLSLIHCAKFIRHITGFIRLLNVVRFFYFRIFKTNKTIFCHAVLSVPCGLVVTCYERTDPLALLYILLSCVLSGVVFESIDS